MSDADLPALALAAYRSRQARARRLRAFGTLTEAQAEADARPWAAIAILAGADVPEFREYLADGPTIAGAARPSAGLRTSFAADFASRAGIVAALAEARDRAIDRATATRQPEHIAAARSLRALADGFAWDINGRHHLPPYQPRAAQAPTERKAA